MTRCVRLAMALAVSLVAAACSDDDNKGGTTQPTPAISIAPSAGTVSVTQGRTDSTITVTLTRTGGYTGDVSIAASGAPAGVTVTPVSTTLSGNTVTTVLRIAATSTAAAGTTPITITASGSGVTSATSTVNVTVAAAATPAVTVALDSSALRINPGATRTANITITRTGGYTGAVNLAVDTTTLPRGVRATLTPASIAAGATTAVLTLTADTTAVVSATPVNVRITASGTGITSQTSTVALTVAQPAGFTVGSFVGANNVTLAPAGTGAVRFLVTRTGGFTGPLTFAADTAGLPRGVVVTSVAVTGDTATVNFRADSTVTAGSFTVTLRGTGTGVTARTLTVPLTLQPRGTFTTTGPTGAVTVQAGTTVTIPIRIARTGGFTGRVTFVASGLPAGATATFDSASVTGTTDTTATLRISVPATVAAGTYTFQVASTTAGLPQQTQTITLNVTPAIPVGFAFVPSQSFGVVSGGTNTVPLLITRTGGFADSVTYTIAGAPAGVTVTAARVAPGGTTSNLTITAAPGVLAGVYPVTITGVGPNGVQTTAPFNITVVTNNTSGAFAFVAPATNASVRAGDTTSTTVGVVRVGNLADSATVIVQNVPTGLTVTLDRNRTGGAPITLRIAAASTLAPGTYTFTVAGATVLGPVPPVTVRVTVTASTTTTTGATRLRVGALAP